MSEEGLDNGADAPTDTPPAGDTPPADNPTPPADTPPADTPPADTPPADDTPPAEGDFKLPDEYKDKPWAEKVKSQEDVYKQLDNLNTLAGKKHAYPEADATAEQLTEYYQGLRPESADKYDFGEDHPNPEIASKFGEMLFNSNVSEHQSKQLIADYNAFEKATIEEATSAEGFEAVMKEKFPDGYDAIVVSTDARMKDVLDDGEKALLNNMPNKFTSLMYKMNDSHDKEIAALKKEYGVKEGGDDMHNNKDGSPAIGVDIEKVRSDIRQEIRDLEKGQHTVTQKNNLVEKLQATYVTKK